MSLYHVVYRYAIDFDLEVYSSTDWIKIKYERSAVEMKSEE